MIIFIALTVAFVIWGQAWEWSIDQALQQLRPYGALATPMAFLLLVCDLFLPIPATAVMEGLGGLYGPWLGGLIGDGRVVLLWVPCLRIVSTIRPEGSRHLIEQG